MMMPSRKHPRRSTFFAACLGAALFLLMVSPAHAQGTRSLPLCVGNVWSGDASGNSLTEKLDDVEALGLGVVRHATGGNALTGGGLPRTRAVAEALRARGLTALLAVTMPSAAEERVPTAGEVYAGGAAYGPFLREYSDVYRYGVQVGNEANNKIERAHRRVIVGGGTEAEARQAAREAAEYFASYVIAYAEGVRSTCPECQVATGGLGGHGLTGQRRMASEMYLELLAPHVQAGVVAPVLDVHVYRGRNSFDRDARGRLRWTEGFSAAITDLLADTGWPSTTALQSTEANVPADHWSTAEARDEALDALLRGLFAVPRMDLVCLFSPWSEKKDDRWLVRPGTSTGETVRRVATEER